MDRWGIYHSEIISKQWFGCQAIIKPYNKYKHLDFLQHRTSFDGIITDEFIDWINNEFRRKLNRSIPISPSLFDPNKIIKIKSTCGKFEGEARCGDFVGEIPTRGRYGEYYGTYFGYLNIGCWEI